MYVCITSIPPFFWSCHLWSSINTIATCLLHIHQWCGDTWQHARWHEKDAPAPQPVRLPRYSWKLPRNCRGRSEKYSMSLGDNHRTCFAILKFCHAAFLPHFSLPFRHSSILPFLLLTLCHSTQKNVAILTLCHFFILAHYHSATPSLLLFIPYWIMTDQWFMTLHICVVDEDKQQSNMILLIYTHPSSQTPRLLHKCCYIIMCYGIIHIM